MGVTNACEKYCFSENFRGRCQGWLTADGQGLQTGATRSINILSLGTLRTHLSITLDEFALKCAKSPREADNSGQGRPTEIYVIIIHREWFECVRNVCGWFYFIYFADGVLGCVDVRLWSVKLFNTANIKKILVFIYWYVDDCFLIIYMMYPQPI